MLLRSGLLALAAGVAMLILQVPIGKVGVAALGVQATWSRRCAPIRVGAHLVGAVRAGELRGARLADRPRRIRDRCCCCRRFSNGVNIALSVFFVLGLGWGVAGAAWGSVARRSGDGDRRGLRSPGGAQGCAAATAPKSSRSQGLKRMMAVNSRHHDPLVRAAFRLRVLHPAGRAASAMSCSPPTPS